MHPLLKKLSGGDRRSIGRSNEVVDHVLAHPAHLSHVFEGLAVDDPVVRMRAADAIEKITARRPDHSASRTHRQRTRRRARHSLRLSARQKQHRENLRHASSLGFSRDRRQTKSPNYSADRRTNRGRHRRHARSRPQDTATAKISFIAPPTISVGTNPAPAGPALLFISPRSATKSFPHPRLVPPTPNRLRCSSHK